MRTPPPRLQPPRLIITPSTPLQFDEYFSALSSPALPSPSSSATSSTSTFSEKQSQSHATTNDIIISQSRSQGRRSGTRPKPYRSHSTPSDFQFEFSSIHLAPPPANLPHPTTGKRPLRSPLITLSILIVSLLLVFSSVGLCGSSQGGRMVEIKDVQMNRLKGLLGLLIPTELDEWDYDQGGEAYLYPEENGASASSSASALIAGSTGTGGGAGILSHAEWEQYQEVRPKDGQGDVPTSTLGVDVWDFQ
ncbi:hypothetical protein CI109_104154 [Kwoniella shandongensis]|uniref:Uncharacterized protein n=1 Tax=Kwoniella shandongensis TaxID=1734106 RepID=A0AAJ8MXJ8_9TREE